MFLNNEQYSLFVLSNIYFLARLNFLTYCDFVFPLNGLACFLALLSP